LIGVYGLTLIAVPMFASPLVMMGDAAPGQRRHVAFLSALIVGVPLLVLGGYGAVRIAAAPSEPMGGVKLRIVQPSVPQREKWRPENQGAIFQDHLALSVTAPSGTRDDLAGITHVVWPEAAMPFLPLEHPEALEAIGAMLPDNVQLLTGALRRETDAGSEQPLRFRAFNSLMLFDGEGRLKGTYDKTHLVPFGEYLPWQSTLEAIGLEQLTRMRGGFSEGVVPRPPLHVPGLPSVGPLICYEAIFPGVGRASAARPGLLVNVTNDGWFGNTTGPRQHFHQARVRAVEEGTPLIRAANNGISAVVDSVGRVIVMLGVNERGSIDSHLPRSHSPPLYAVVGDMGFLAVGLLFVATLAAIGRISSPINVQ
jgi:apolipoprotein N-acyltransferase